jgi:hypothetical protein
MKLPEPTLPNPSEAIGPSMPLWLGMVLMASALVPWGILVFMAVTGR